MLRTTAYTTIRPNSKSDYRDGYIHPSVTLQGPITLGRNVTIEENVVVGPDCFFGHNATVRPNVTLGKGAEVRVNGWVANDVTIGDYTVIYNFANVAAYTVIGDYVYFGVYAMTTNADDIVLHRARKFVPRPVIIRDGARIASKVAILPGRVLGENCLIGAGSLLTKDVGPNEVWLGHPAKKVGMVREGDVIVPK